jgi:hypothetical protein
MGRCSNTCRCSRIQSTLPCVANYRKASGRVERHSVCIGPPSKHRCYCRSTAALVRVPVRIPVQHHLSHVAQVYAYDRLN